MSRNLEFDFSIDKENHSITVTREFDAKLPLVWDAYTTPDIIDKWWAPKPWKAKTKSMDFTNGGIWQYAMIGPDGEEHWALAKFDNIHHQKSYSGLDAFADADGKINTDMPQSRWEVEFTDKGETTWVVYHIVYDDLAQLEATIQMGFKEGLTMAMEGLDELLLFLKNKSN